MHTFLTTKCIYAPCGYEGKKGVLAPTLNVGAPWTWIRAPFHKLNRSAFPRTAWEREQKEGELERDSVCANFARTAEDGKTYQVEHYNLDVIISVGYRVKSKQGVGVLEIIQANYLGDYRLLLTFNDGS